MLLQPPPDTNAAKIARARFEEPRKGEVLMPLRGPELEEKSKELATSVNKRKRLIQATKDYVAAARDTKKTLDEQIEQLSCEVEYREHWVPAQQQFDGLLHTVGAANTASERPTEPPPASEEDAATEQTAATANGRRSPRARRAS